MTNKRVRGDGSETRNTGKKRKGWIGILIGAVMGGIAGWSGMSAIYGGEAAETAGGWLLLIGKVMLAMCLAVYLQIIVHEAGHLLFGRLSGYRFASFRIGRWMLIRQNGKLRSKRYTVDGTGGQCLMRPPGDVGDAYPVFIYNFGGVILNLTVGLVALLLFLLAPGGAFYSALCGVLFAAGLIFAALNGIPLRISGMPNDGYNARMLGKDPQVRRAFWQQLRINADLGDGMRLRDMPEEWFFVPPDADLSDPLICSAAILACSRLHDQRLFAEAREESRRILRETPRMVPALENELLCELLFYEIMEENRAAEVARLDTKSLQKYRKLTAGYVQRIRLSYAYARLVSKDRQQAEKLLAAFEKAARAYPYEGEIAAERELLTMIDERAARTGETEGDEI